MPANNTTRRLIKAAGWIHERCCQRSRDERRNRLQSTSSYIQPHVDLVRQHERELLAASYRGFSLCRPQLEARYERALRDLARRIEQMAGRWCEPWCRCPTMRELFEDLREAEEEFGGVEIDFNAQTVAVCTDRIVLEGVPLGAFRIVLEVSGLAASSGESPRYFVEALDPNPANTNHSVTHPHVDGETLCAGEALVPLSSAIAQGRICDFFVLVRSVLETYNEASAYVQLDEWSAVSCHECGEPVGEDEINDCRRCEHDYCGECSSVCHGCHTTECYGCLMRSQCSELTFCETCTSTCVVCDRICGRDELEDDMCPACIEQAEQLRKEESNDENTNEQARAAHDGSAESGATESASEATGQSGRPESLESEDTPATSPAQIVEAPSEPAARSRVLREGMAQTPLPLPQR